MKLLLTGYGGLIGHALREAFLPLNGVTLLCAGRGKASDILLDLTAPQAADLHIPERIECWVHAAGVTDEEVKRSPEDAMRRATEHTENFLRILLTRGLQRVVYVSSAHVYGPLEGKIDEESAVKPVSIYAQAHRATEKVLMRYLEAGELSSLLILRPCAVYGMPPALEQFGRWSLIPYSFPKELAESGTVTLQTSGLQERNFVHTSTVAACVVKYISLADTGGLSLVNPAGFYSFSVRGFAEHCVALASPLLQRVCRVIVPQADTPPPSPLLFESRHGSNEAPHLLDAFLTHLITELHARHDTRRP